MDIVIFIIQILIIIFVVVAIPTFIMMLIAICKLGDEPIKFTYEIDIHGDSEKESKSEKED